MRCRSADRSGLLGEALLAGGICLFPARGHSLVGVGEGGAGGGHTLAAGVDGRAVEPPVVRSGPSWSGANRSDGGPRNAGRCGRRSNVGGGRCWLPIGVMCSTVGAGGLGRNRDEGELRGHGSSMGMGCDTRAPGTGPHLSNYRERRFRVSLGSDVPGTDPETGGGGIRRLSARTRCPLKRPSGP